MSKTIEEKAEYDRIYRQANKEKISEQKKERYNTPHGRAFCLINNYKQKDKKLNRGECTLTAEWIISNIFSKSCHYCGETDWRKLGCDRIDNSKPHTVDNVVPCCLKCNNERQKMNYEEYINKKRLGSHHTQA